MAKLKVYRTPAGFHDAYVAAPSQKAALAAWGSDADLFARGIAEVVVDPQLAKAPLARPGEVIKVARTDVDAPESRRPEKRPAKAKAKDERASAGKPRPRPSRARLDAAEAALADAETRHAEQRAALERDEAELAKRRRALDRSEAEEAAKLDRARVKARDAYQKALTAWRE